MSCNNVQILNFNHNIVEVGSDNKLIITDNVKCNSITIPQPVTNILQINSPGPQGPQGPSGSAGSGGNINTGSFVTTSSFNAFTASYNTFTGSYNTGSFTGSFTGSLLGTASFATTASFALNASSGGPTNLISTGSVTASVSIDDGIFKIISGSSTFVYVSSSGNIGLGNIPTYSLDINLGNAKSVRFQSGTGQLNSFFGSAFGNTLISNNIYYNGSNWIYEKNATAILLQLGNNGGVILNNYPSQTAGTSGLPSPNGTIYMSPTGDIGLGTTTPGYRLDVSGSLNVSNLIYLNGSAGNTGEVLTSQGSSTSPIWAVPTASFGYTQLLQIFSQTAGDAPVVDFELNTTEDTYTWNKIADGEYALTADIGTPFTEGKTSVVLSGGFADGAYISQYQIANTSTIKVYSRLPDAQGADRVFLQATIDIKIFS
jgi:hypothetical protein